MSEGSDILEDSYFQLGDQITLPARDGGQEGVEVLRCVEDAVVADEVAVQLGPLLARDLHLHRRLPHQERLRLALKSIWRV